MRVSIFGLGYVGAVTVACLARDGHTVIGVDVDQSKLDLIAAGKTPCVEEGMVELMQQVVASGCVSVTRDAQRAVLDSDISLICVGTPSAANGTFAGALILGVAQGIGFRWDPGWGVLIGHLTFLVILVVRPQGLFPKTRD